jgi:hypothetical protein
VTAFYTYWLNFSSGRSDRAFAQHDKWDLREAPSPMMRRLMHQKNMAVREKARAMFNDKARRRAMPLLPCTSSRASPAPATVAMPSLPGTPLGCVGEDPRPKTLRARRRAGQRWRRAGGGGGGVVRLRRVQ